MLILSGILIWMRTKMHQPQEEKKNNKSSLSYWLRVIIVGLGTGGLSGVFGIGSTPFIQLSLLVFFGFSMRKAIGTTMLIILPIAFFGAVGFLQAGFF